MNPTMVQGLEIRKVGDEVLVHDTAQQKVHVLNDVAGRIMELCDGTRSNAAIASQVSAETGADLAIVGPDVDAIVAQFLDLNLLQRS